MIPEFSDEIIFIASNPGPLEHFEQFSKTLEGRSVKLLSLKGLISEGKDLEDLAKAVVKACQTSKCVIIEVGHPFYELLMQTLQQELPRVKRVAYYDNRERYVSGYSETASKVCSLAETILFANKNHVNELPYATLNELMPIDHKQLLGIGYFNFEEIEAMRELRDESKKLRKAFLKSQGLEERGQKIIVYFGGSNTDYFSHAFPLFCNLLKQGTKKENLSNTIILLQQHPRAKLDNNLDALLLNSVSLVSKNAPDRIISNLPFAEAAALADLAFYHQTTSSYKLALLGVPLAQIGKVGDQDLLVSSSLCPEIENVDQLLDVIKRKKGDIQQDLSSLYSHLGINTDWKENLIDLIATVFE